MTLTVHPRHASYTFDENFFYPAIRKKKKTKFTLHHVTPFSSYDPLFLSIIFFENCIILYILGEQPTIINTLSLQNL